MEMEFKDPGARRRRLLFIVGVTTAVVAGLVAFQMSQGAGAAAAPPKTQKVLVATHDVPARSIMASADVVVRDVPQDPSLAMAMVDPTAVVGRVTTVPLVSGQVVYPTVFVGTTEGSGFSILSPDEVVTADSPFWRAVSVSVPKDRAVAGTIMAGERVDLFVSVRMQVMVFDPLTGIWAEKPTVDGFQTGDSTKLTFQDLEVLEAEPDEGLYVLKVDLHQAEQINHDAKVAPGSFSLALRPDADTRQANPGEFGETNDSLITRYLYRVPQLLDLQTLSAGQDQVVPLYPRVPSRQAPTTPTTSPAPGTSPLPSAPAPSATP
jgi:Flp pilus assembly protein CpaB